MTIEMMVAFSETENRWEQACWERGQVSFRHTEFEEPVGSPGESQWRVGCMTWLRRYITLYKQFLGNKYMCVCVTTYIHIYIYMLYR